MSPLRGVGHAVKLFSVRVYVRMSNGRTYSWGETERCRDDAAGGMALFACPATMCMLTYVTISSDTLLTYLEGDGVGLARAQRRWRAIRECSGGAMPTTSSRDQSFLPACRPPYAGVLPAPLRYDLMRWRTRRGHAAGGRETLQSAEGDVSFRSPVQRAGLTTEGECMAVLPEKHIYIYVHS